MYEVSVAIVDDDENQIQVIQSLLEAHGDLAHFSIKSYTTLKAFESALVHGDVPQIVFMDIVFDGTDKNPSPDGIAFVKRLLSRYGAIQVIYTTGYTEFCTRVYRTDHAYLLMKPIEEIDFIDAVVKALDNLKENANRPFGIKVGSRIVRISPSDIEYIESDRRKVAIHMANNESVEAYEALAGLAEKLPSSFIQSHKSFLVNMSYVTEMTGEKIELQSGKIVPISQKRSKAVRRAFLEYLRDRL